MLSVTTTERNARIQMVPCDVELERKKVDDEIAVLEDQICQLKIKRNSLAPIFALPNELLCRIFLECRGQAMQISDGGFPTWIAVTRVCSTWRTASLEYPQLWSNIDSALSLFWMRLFFSRAQLSPLSLTISQEREARFSNEKMRIMSSILRDHQRLERAIIEMRGEELHGLLQNLTEEMPNIFEFSLHKSVFGDFNLPSPLFADHAPQLRVLSLKHIEPPWASPIMEGLTSLSIIDEHFCQIPRPSLSTFFDTLSRMHGLQHLAIENALPSPDPSDPYIPSLDLPSLHSLKLRGNCEQCSVVVRHIQIPKLAEVKLCISDADDSRLKELFWTLRSSWPGGPVSKPGNQPGEVVECHSIALSGINPGGVSISICQSDRPSPFTLVVASMEWSRSHQSLLMNLIPSRNLTSLSIFNDCSFESSILKVTLAHLTSVTKFSISSSPFSAFHIFQFLLEKASTAKGASGSPAPSKTAIYLPRLIALHIGRIHFTRESDSVKKPYGLRLADLKRWLRFRQKSGASIQHLEIVDCENMTPSTAHTLQDCMGAGGRVVWDGIVRKEAVVGSPS
jgi:F-box-like